MPQQRESTEYWRRRSFFHHALRHQLYLSQEGFASKIIDDDADSDLHPVIEFYSVDESEAVYGFLCAVGATVPVLSQAEE